MLDLKLASCIALKAVRFAVKLHTGAPSTKYSKQGLHQAQFAFAAVTGFVRPRLV